MKKIRSIYLVLFLFCAFSIILVKNGRASRQIAINIPYLPGDKLPPASICRWEYHYIPDQHLYCQGEGGRWYVYYNTHTGVIDSVSYDLYDSGYLVGDLILAWGVPEHVEYSASFQTLYWNNRYIYAYGKIFNPNSRILIVNYFSSEPYHSHWESWKGFKNE